MDKFLRLGIFDTNLQGKNEELQRYLEGISGPSIQINCYDKPYKIGDKKYDRKKYNTIFVHSGDFISEEDMEEFIDKCEEEKRHVYWVSSGKFSKEAKKYLVKKSKTGFESITVDIELKGINEYKKLNWKDAFIQFYDDFLKQSKQKFFVPKFPIEKLIEKNDNIKELSDFLEPINILIQGWLSIWDWDKNTGWQVIKEKIKPSDDILNKIKAWDKTRPDKLFRTKETDKNFWFDTCEAEIVKNSTNLFSKEINEVLKDRLFWHYPKLEDIKSTFIDCVPILHPISSLEKATIIASQLAKPDWKEQPISYNSYGGCIRLIWEAIRWGLLPTKEIERKMLKINGDRDLIKKLIQSLREVLVQKDLIVSWNSDEEKAARDAFNREDNQIDKIRQKIEWLFKNAFSEYMMVLNTQKIKKILSEFEDKRHTLHHLHIIKPPFCYLWQNTLSELDKNVEDALSVWSKDISSTLRSISDGSLLPNIKRDLPKTLPCNDENFNQMGVPAQFHKKLISQNNNRKDFIEIDILKVIDKIDEYAEKVLVNNEILNKTEKKDLVDSVFVSLWLQQFRGVKNLIPFIKHIDGWPFYPMEEVNG
ncbi:hypothetical protein [Desulfobacula sp.]|uniref:Uncharacterized protein n=1 Tax=Candidatus Desulfatibia vada TaxID=2841696 RepID=A0A8J6NYL4_9BACT|nr:hypothetical protein [Candidatus Desulfatibia vada]MBL6994168.1 hypothetical protein [Desulfobacula sp.]